MNLIEELKNEGLVERVIPKMETASDKVKEKKKAPPPAKLDQSKGQNIPEEEPEENPDEVDDAGADGGEAPDDEGDPGEAADSFEAHMISPESAFRSAIDMALFLGKKWAEEVGEEDAKSGMIGECMIKLKECQQAYDNLYKNKDADQNKTPDQNQNNGGGEAPHGSGQTATAKGHNDDLAAAAQAVSGGGAKPDQKEA